MKKKINENLQKEFITEVVKLLNEKRFAELKDNEIYSVGICVNGFERKEIYSTATRQVMVSAVPEYGDNIVGKPFPIKYWNVKKTEEKRKESVLKVD